MSGWSPLVTVDELSGRLDDPTLRIVDCRFRLDDPADGRRLYEVGHIPGAVYVSLDDDLSGPSGPGRHPLPEPNVFAGRLATLGVGDEHEVVAYDDAGGAYAARLWWMRRATGHSRVAVLDGGYQAWLASGLHVSTETPSYPAAAWSAVFEWPGVVDRAGVAEISSHATMVDARAAERYQGEVEPWDPVAGHIPGAVNLPYADNLGADGTFLSVDALRDRYSVIPPDRPVVVYCGSGVTACHDLLAMELAGIEGVALYPGSWSDWSTSGGPVATGPEPG